VLRHPSPRCSAVGRACRPESVREGTGGEGTCGEGRAMRDVPSGPDVLVEVEQVARVVAALDLLQPGIVDPVVGCHLRLVVGGGEVDLDAPQ